MIEWTDPQQIALQRLKIIIIAKKSVMVWHKWMKFSYTRLDVLKQWARTEKSYLENLQIIKGRIKQPLVKAGLIKQQEQRTLFANLIPMMQLSHKIFGCLQEIIAQWNPNTTKIAQKLIHFYKFFVIYGEYWSNYMKGKQILTNIQKNKEPSIFKNFDYQNYRITPVQRLPKYHLLLQRYYKSLNKGHVDYNLVSQALQKYREIVQKNNSSIDKQIRDDIMIKLDKKYGGIILDRMGREFIRQFTAKYSGLKCKVFAFNNMILLVNQQNQEEQQVFKRLNLNGTSFVIEKRHLKYYSNIVYVCGAYQSAHLQFETQADASYFYEETKQIIAQLYQDERDKLTRYNQSQTKKKNLLRLRITEFHQQNVFKGHNYPKLQITVNETLRIKERAMYYVCFKVINPYNSCQTLLLSMDQMLKVYYFLQSRYKDIHFPKIDVKPDNIWFMEESQSKSRIMEYCSFSIEVFLNYIYRNQMLNTAWQIIGKSFGLSIALIQFSLSKQFNCNCHLCLEMKENQSIQHCQFLLDTFKKAKKDVQHRYSCQNNYQSQCRQSFYSQPARQIVVYKPDCVFYFFQIMHSIFNAKKQKIECFTHKMLCLEAKMGSIRYSLLNQNRLALQKGIRIKINYWSIDENFFQINLKQDRYCMQIIEYFGHRNNIKTILDWGLFLEQEGQIIQIGRDEKILEFAKKLGVQLQQIEQKEQEEAFSFNNIFGGIRKWGQQLVGIKKARLYIKKYLYSDAASQYQECKRSRDRCRLVVNQIFKKFKQGHVYLDQTQIAILCSCYLLITQLHKIKASLQQIQMQKIEDILPERHYDLIKDKKFSFEMIQLIRKNHQSIVNCFQQSQSLRLLFQQILQTLNTDRQWIAQYFVLSSYKGSVQNDVLLRIAHDKLTIFRAQDRTLLLSIQLEKLQYAITPFSIFIRENNQDYRYQGSNICQVKQIIDTYLAQKSLFS